VIRADGSLGGYRWGTKRKARLLNREGRASDLFA
jgi:O6-methylguanine-DNA--protein-cysteine methyltransferase